MRLVTLFVLLCTWGCESSLVSHPDISALAPGVRSTIEAARARFDTTLATAKSPTEEADAWGELGQYYHAHHLVHAAVDCYGRATELDPDAFQWHYLTGHALVDTGDLAAAMVAFEMAIELDPAHRGARYYSALTMLDRGEPREAAGQLRQVDAQQQNAAVQAAIGRALQAQGDARSALPFYERALQLQPSASRLHHPIAQLHRKLGDAARAQYHLSQAGQVDPVFSDPILTSMAALSRSAQMLVERGKSSFSAGDVAAAERDFEAAISADPLDASAHAALGILLSETGQLQRARVAFARALDLEPGNADMLFLDGMLSERLGQFDQAVDRYRQTVTFDPGHVRATFLLGHHALRQQQFGDALNWYEHAAGIAPRDVNARYYAGLAALGDAKCERAVNWFSDAMSRQSNYAPVIIALVRARAVCPAFFDQAEQFLELARDLYEAVPGNESVIATYAMALAAAGRFEEALALQPKGRRFDRNRSRYAERKPADQAWPDDADVFSPPLLGN